MTAVKQSSQQTKQSKKQMSTVSFISLLLGAAALFSPLIPMVVVTPGRKHVLYNMLGVVNQEVGADLTRDDAFPLLIIYVVAVVVMAVGFVNAYVKLKNAPYFIMGASAMLVVFAFVWMNMDNPSREASRTSVSNSVLPYLVLVLSIAALASALLWLLSETGKSNIPERKTAHKPKRKR